MIQANQAGSQPLFSGSANSLTIRTIEVLLLLALPIASFFILHLSPLNQAGYLDPYYYTGYIHNMPDLIDRYGLPYYAVRFGLILPARLLGLAFGFDAGYLLFRYILALIAGVPLYFLSRHLFGRPAGMSLYCALLTTPLLTRSLFWDHPDAAAVPYLLGAIGLFLLDHGVLWDLIAGLLFGLAIHCNFFTISITAVFFGAFLLAAIVLHLPIRRVILRIGWIGAGAVLITVMGVLYYLWAFRLWNIFSPTLGISRWLSTGGMSQWRLAGISWIGPNYHVLVLPIIGVCTVIVSRLRPARLEILAMEIYVVGVSLYFYVYQFVFKADILQLPYYYIYSLPAIMFAIVAIVDQLWRGSNNSQSWQRASILAGSFLGPWLIGVYVWNWFPSVNIVKVVISSALALVALTGCTLIRPRRLKNGAESLATIALGLFLAIGFSSTAYASVFWNRRPLERDVYHVTEQLISTVPAQRDRPGQVCFWYNNHPGNLINSVQSAYLWGISRCSSPAADVAGMPTVGESELKTFHDPQLKYIALLGESQKEITQALAALRASDLHFVPVDTRTLNSGTYSVYFAYLEIVRK